MNFWLTAAWLAQTSARNRFMGQLNRLRQPRYLIGTGVAILYLSSIGLRRILFAGHGLAPESLSLVKLSLFALVVIAISLSWVLGGDEDGLAFTEAEIQFLFPAPVTRATLLRYRVVRLTLMASFSAMLMTLLTGSRLSSHPLFFWAGLWLGTATMALHFTGASLTRMMLMDLGVAGLRRRILTLTAFGTGVVVLGLGVSQVGMPPLHTVSLANWYTWADGLFQNQTLSWVLYLFTGPLDMALATDTASFIRAIPMTILLWVVHYFWVTSSTVAFEEASIAASQRRANRLSRMRRGDTAPILRHARPLFRLQSIGRPEWAIIWKAWLAAVRLLSLRWAIVLGIAAIGGAILALIFQGGMGIFIAFVGGMAAFTFAFLGPNSMRIDLRLDLPMMDVLRTWPVDGRSMIRGHLFAITALLSVATLASLSVMFIGLAVAPESPLKGMALFCVFLAAIIAFPAFILASAFLQNASAVLFPAWVQVDPKAGRGLEVFGQRLLFMVGNLIIILGAGIPAVVIGTPVAILAGPFIGAVVLPILAGLFALVLGLEVWFAIQWLGRQYEKFEAEH